MTHRRCEFSDVKPFDIRRSRRGHFDFKSRRFLPPKWSSGTGLTKRESSRRTIVAYLQSLSRSPSDAPSAKPSLNL